MKNNLVRNMILLMDVVMVFFVFYVFIKVSYFTTFHSAYPYRFKVFLTEHGNVVGGLLIASCYVLFLIVQSIYFYVLYSVRKVVIVSELQHPFSAENIHLARKTGIAFLILTCYHFCIALSFNHLGIYKRFVGLPSLNFILFFVLGMSLLVLSRIFTVGSAMRTEQDLTV
jgi:hypothetical protein